MSDIQTSECPKYPHDDDNERDDDPDVPHVTGVLPKKGRSVYVIISES